MTDGDGWVVRLTNNGDSDLTNIFVSLRLPLIYKDGVSNHSVDVLPAGDRLVLQFAAGQIDADPALRDGSLFAAAQIDFTDPSGEGRIYAVYEGKTDLAPVVCLRDSSLVAGPFAVGAIEPDSLLALSQFGSQLAAINDSPLGQWRSAKSESSKDFVRDRFITFSSDAAWRTAAEAYKRQPAHLLVAVDFSLSELAPLKIESERAIVFVLVDGAVMPLSGWRTKMLEVGNHRVIICVDADKRMSFAGEEPQNLLLSVNGERLTHLISPNVL
jgi:hypothetical protein